MSDKDNDIDRRLEQFTENPVARAFLQLLPGGSSIDAAISARVAQVQRVRLEWEHRRSEAALIDLIDWLNDLDQSKLDRGYMTSEQFADDFLEWYDRAVHVSQSLKREALRNAFLNGATIDWRKSGLRDLFTPLIADFSAPQIHLLRTVQLRERARLKDKEEGFSDESLEPPQMVTLNQPSEAVGGISADHLLALAQDFVRKGLVRDWWQGTFKADEQVLERITLTPLGREFLRFIAEPPTSSKLGC